MSRAVSLVKQSAMLDLLVSRLNLCRSILVAKQLYVNALSGAGINMDARQRFEASRTLT